MGLTDDLEVLVKAWRITADLTTVDTDLTVGLVAGYRKCAYDLDRLVAGRKSSEGEL